MNSEPAAIETGEENADGARKEKGKKGKAKDPFTREKVDIDGDEFKISFSDDSDMSDEESDEDDESEEKPSTILISCDNNWIFYSLLFHVWFCTSS